MNLFPPVHSQFKESATSNVARKSGTRSGFCFGRNRISKFLLAAIAYGSVQTPLRGRRRGPFHFELYGYTRCGVGVAFAFKKMRQKAKQGFDFHWVQFWLHSADI